MISIFPTIQNRLTGMLSEDRVEFVGSLNVYDLLIIDDLGVERSTKYTMEQMFSMVDSRYRSRKPMIITTNLRLEEIKKPPDLAHARIYDHILKRCASILFVGKMQRRSKQGSSKWDCIPKSTVRLFFRERSSYERPKDHHYHRPHR